MAVIVDLFRYLAGRIPFAPRHPLIDRGFGLIYDVERDLTWLKDTNYAKTTGRSPDGQMTWYQAMHWVASLSYRGEGGWRLPTALNPDGSGPCIGHNCNRSEIGHLVLGAIESDPGHVAFLNFQNNAKYWNSTEASPTEAYGWDFFSLRQGTVLKDPSTDEFGLTTLTGPILSWPVHDGDVAWVLVQRLFTLRIKARSSIFGR